MGSGDLSRDHEQRDRQDQAEPRRRNGELSALVHEILRQAGHPLIPGQVLDRLRETGAGPLAYTTVVTILSRLHAQGIADRSRAGRAYAYRAAASEAELAGRRMRRLLDAEDDRAGVLASFVDGLSTRDEWVLRDLLGHGEASGESGGRRVPRAE